MAKIILSALISAIKGTYSGSTFQDWKGIKAYKDKVIDPQEAVTLLYSLIKLLRKAFPKL